MPLDTATIKEARQHKARLPFVGWTPTIRADQLELGYIRIKNDGSRAEVVGVRFTPLVVIVTERPIRRGTLAEVEYTSRLNHSTRVPILIGDDTDQ